MNYVIGCGGVGSWLVPKLAKLTEDIILFDGDTLEEKNLDRQLFDEDDLGENKASALAYKYLIDTGDLNSVSENEEHERLFLDEHFRPEFFHAGLGHEFRPEDIIFCCADNQAARREVLQTCDDRQCQCVIGANEYTDAEAYWYSPSWKDTPNDPRLFYPVILTDRTGDPLAPEGCTGAAAIASPQLVLANDWACGLMLHLFWFYDQVKPEFMDDFKPGDDASWPVMHKINKFRTQTIRKGDRK